MDLAPSQQDPTNQEASLQVMLNALQLPLLRLGSQNEILYANLAAESFFQTSAAVLCRMKINDFIPFGSPLLSLVDQSKSRGASISEYGVDIGSPRNGASKPVDIQVSPIFETAGEILLLLQERSVAQKMDRQLTYQSAARSVTGLAAMLAHEIKNPLSGIRGAAQLLESAVGEDDQSLTNLIREEVDRICGLVDRMEAFGDERPIDREQLNIHTVLDHVKNIATSGFASHINFHDEYDPSLPPVFANRDQLIQIFLNLVKNAAEAIGPDKKGGEIILRSAFKPGMKLSMPGAAETVTLPLEFSVIDNGDGFPDELLPHLFDPFVTTKVSGSGLGLALVAKIIRDHGGVIEAERMSGKTVFRILMSRYVEA